MHAPVAAEEVNHFHILRNVQAMRPSAGGRINVRSMIGTVRLSVGTGDHRTRRGAQVETFLR